MLWQFRSRDLLTDRLVNGVIYELGPKDLAP